MTLRGKSALVIGGGRNIGKGIAVALAQAGANVAVSGGRQRAEVEATAGEIRALGVKSAGLVGDAGSHADVARVAKEAAAAVGRIDILVYTPAIRPHQAFLEITDEDWERVLAVNLRGAFFAAQAVLPGMVEQKWGRILLISGLIGFTGAKGGAHIATSKAGLLGLSRGLALEFAAQGITVNTIVPGTFDTERAEQWVVSEERRLEAPSRAVAEAQRPGIPVGRLGMTREIGAMAAYLASDAAAFVTGQSIHINGGAYVT
ncbi:MAG: SDR family oxidoreductase [Dehalococcoidia bacterium]|nr:SDR family oxidoreductase [Dehalococcoidia bacterium]